jgi:hypothetical protein
MTTNYQPVADAIEVSLAGQTFFAERKLFSTGSRGFYGNGKAVIEVGEKGASDKRRYQVSITVTEIGSKGTVTVARPVAEAPVAEKPAEKPADSLAPRLAASKK